MGQILSIIGLLYVRNCNRRMVINDLSLFPPYPVYYRITETGDHYSGTYGVDHNQSDIPSSITILRISVTHEISICVFHYKRQSAEYRFHVQKTPKRCLIISHGNATDIGCYINSMLLLGDELDIDVIIYDYQGFGCSDGIACCGSLCSDLRAVYDYATQFFEGRNIFFLGESLGTVPSCFVASSLFNDYYNRMNTSGSAQYPLGGVILQGAFYSGVKILPCGCLFRDCDPYNNASVIGNIDCPVFLIHGEQDNMIDLKWAMKLNDMTTSPYPPWWVKDGGHINILSKFEKDYLRQLNDFMKYCDSHNFII